MSLTNKDIIKIQKSLKTKLKDSRYQHTLGVAYTAASMAMKYSVDVNKAYIAGLLHDCAKYMESEEMLVKAQKFGLDISKAEKVKPDLLHAKLGAYYAKKKYYVEDEEILSSICSHTTGKPNMSLLDKIVYIADYIEPNRNKMPRLDLIRRKAFEDIDECLCMILEDTVAYLKDTGVYMDETTLKTYEYYCNK